MTPNRENIAKWADALESGDYTQAKGSLHEVQRDGTEGFCCLGVACDLAVKAGVRVDVNRPGLLMPFGDVYYDNDNGVLPTAVQEWLGVPLQNPHLTDADGSSFTAAQWNDGDMRGEPSRPRKTFTEIAVMIRRTFLTDDGE